MKIVLKKSKKPGLGGFTLAEVMVGSMTFMITAASLYTGIAHGFNVVRSAREELRANQIMLDKLEAVRLYNWTQMNNQWVSASFTDVFDPTAGTTTANRDYNLQTTGTVSCTESCGTVYTGSIRLEDAGMPAAYNSMMKRVVVTISWTSGNITKTRSVSTLISQYGTQKFIYTQ